MPSLLLALILIGQAPTQEPAPDALAQSGPVRIVSQAARWTGLPTLDQLGDDRETMFLVSGELENNGTAPVLSVRKKK